MLDAASQAIARALRSLVDQKPDEAEQALAEGYAALSLDRDLLLVLDARTLRSQLGDEDKLAMATRLLLCDAELQWHKGASSAASRRLNAARRLLAEHSAPPAELHAELSRVADSLNSAP